MRKGCGLSEVINKIVKSGRVFGMSVAIYVSPLAMSTPYKRFGERVRAAGLFVNANPMLVNKITKYV